MKKEKKELYLQELNRTKDFKNKMFLQTRVCLKLLHQGEYTRNFRSEFGSSTNSDNVPITCKDQSLGSQHPSLCLLSCLHCIVRAGGTFAL